MFWKIAIGIIVIIVSSLVTSVTVTVPMCCVNMGLPFSKQVQLETGVDTSKLRGMYIRSLLLWAVVNAIIAAVLCVFVPAFYCYMALAGAVLTLLRGLGPSGVNPSNIQDWYAMCEKHMSEEELAAVTEYLQHRTNGT